MNKKFRFPVKQLIGILLLIAIVYRTDQVTHYMEKHPVSSSVISLDEFLEFLEDFFGVKELNALLSNAPRFFNPQGQNKQGAGQNGYADGTNRKNSNSAKWKNLNAQQQAALAERENGFLNTSSTNALHDSGDNTQGNLEAGSENNAEFNPALNSELAKENVSLNSTEGSTEAAAGNNPGQITETNAESNAETNAENSPGSDSGGPSAGTTGSSSSSNSGGSSTDNPGGNSGNNPGNTFGGTLGSSSGGSVNPSDLPTINPIPSDDSVAKTIAQQNQQNTALSTLLATRQALVAPVQQQAQAAKYQTVNTQNIAPPSTNQAPGDIIEKVKLRELSLH